MWTALSDALPIYPLYALLFADTGLSEAEISVLLITWSAVGIVAEVPTGALADRFSRRGALVVSGLAAAAGFVIWITFPGLAGFVAGFVVWGIGGALASGTLEALVYDGLAAAGAADRFAAVRGRTEAASLAVQVPVAFAASGLFAVGGYQLVGWASVVTSVLAAAVACLLPDARPTRHRRPDDQPGYLDTLRAGVVEAVRHPPVRAAAIAVAVLCGVESLEEYYPLLAGGWGLPVGVIPLALAAVPFAGAIGSSLGGWGSRLRIGVLAAGLVAAAAFFGAAVLVRHPVGVVAITAGYGLIRLVLVVAETRLQDAISSAARATVSSAANLGSELAAVAMFGLWALGGPVVVAGAVLVVLLAVPRLLRRRSVTMQP